MNDGSEDDLSAVSHRKSHPENEDELEDVVECCYMLAPDLRHVDGQPYGTNRLR